MDITEEMLANTRARSKDDASVYDSVRDEPSDEGDWPSDLNNIAELQAEISPIPQYPFMDENCRLQETMPMSTFVRVYLAQLKMWDALQEFEAEWVQYLCDHDLEDESQVPNLSDIPDEYVAHFFLEERLNRLKSLVEKNQTVQKKRLTAIERMVKSRDVWRQRHMVVAQDKHRYDKQLADLSNRGQQYEPTLLDMKEKLDVASEQRMLMEVERDRLLGHLDNLKSAERRRREEAGEPVDEPTPRKKDPIEIVLEEARRKRLAKANRPKPPKDSEWPHPKVHANRQSTEDVGPFTFGESRRGTDATLNSQAMNLHANVQGFQSGQVHIN